MASETGADVVIVGTGVVGCLVAEKALDAGLSVLMLEAGPRVDRWRIVENYRNLPPSLRLFHWDAPYPPKPWAPHLETRTEKESEQYLQLEGPNARAYLQGYVRYAGGATWHWAGLSWRISPDDMRLKSLYGVGRDCGDSDELVSSSAALKRRRYRSENSVEPYSPSIRFTALLSCWSVRRASFAQSII